jgi:predicted amidophosphoribosyltransferase
MPTVGELTAPAGNYLLNPRPGPGVCRVCCNLTDGFVRCYACGSVESRIAAVAPISYSFAGGQLHHALAGYKRYAGPAARHLAAGLAAVLWRHLGDHERCLARAAAVDRFDVVTTVPSSDRSRDGTHPLHTLVGEVVKPLQPRFERLLHRTDAAVTAHRFGAQRYEACKDLRGRAILLIDDTWTTGANAQSAAAALKAAGAERVAVVVIGRYVNRAWGHNDRQLRRLPLPFDWGRCALCDEEGPGTNGVGGH